MDSNETTHPCCTVLPDNSTECSDHGEQPPQERRAKQTVSVIGGRRLEDVAVRFAEQALYGNGSQGVDRTARFMLEFHKYALDRAKLPHAPREFDEQRLAQDIGQALILLKSPEDFDVRMAKLYLTGALIALGRSDLVPRA